ncbi:MAG: hypothetical protein IT445_09645 [Phycisphaeraceae bacterium]|nr:hypothetical protein [Phycisphaeraceae bacterium]
MTSQNVDKLIDALKKTFEASVDAENVGANGRYRFVVVSPGFKDMPQLDRQDAIWKVVGDVLPRDVILDISLILAYSPEELEQAA